VSKKPKKRKKKGSGGGGGGTMSSFRGGFKSLVGQGNKNKPKRNATVWDVLFYVAVIGVVGWFVYKRFIAGGG